MIIKYPLIYIIFTFLRPLLNLNKKFTFYIFLNNFLQDYFSDFQLILLSFDNHLQGINMLSGCMCCPSLKPALAICVCKCVCMWEIERDSCRTNVCVGVSSVCLHCHTLSNPLQPKSLALICCVQLLWAILPSEAPATRLFVLTYLSWQHSGILIFSHAANCE